MAMYGAPGTATNAASAAAYEQYLREEAEKRRRETEANAAALAPTATQVGNTEGGMFTDSTPINAYYLDPSIAGGQSTFQNANFYGALDEAQRRGTNIYGQQQSLAQALADRAAGRGGPSLAELQLGQSLQANQQSAAAGLAAAGRSINPALAQRLLLQQRSALQGQTAGQGALLRAKEQLDAQAALGNQLANMRSSETSMYGTSGQLGLGQEKLSVETQEDLKRRQMEIAKQNQAAAQAASGQAQAQGQFESQQTNAMITGAAKGAGTAIAQGATPPAAGAVAAKAQGGMVRRYAEGGKVSKAIATKCMAQGGNVLAEGDYEHLYNSDAYKEILKAYPGASVKNMKMFYDAGARLQVPGSKNWVEKPKENKGGKPHIFQKDSDIPPALRRTEEKDKSYVNAADGGKMNAAMGKLAKMDNEKNDIVPAMLSPGEIVLPRSIVAAPNAPVAAAKFVQALLANRDKKDAKVLALKAALGKK